MQSLEYFNTQSFINALKAFFKELNIPINYIADEPASPEVILGDKWKQNIEAHTLIDEVYALGMVNDAVFEGTGTFQSMEQVRDLKADYDGLLIFGVTLTNRENDLPITRSQLAEITRAFNRAFPYTPVTIVFKYSHYISFANSERIPYKQSYREGEKVGKVTILRDINLLDPHRGHLDILENLNIEKKGRKTIQNFSDLYAYWQEVFSVNVLNKKFYQELSNWYFWAVKHVTFPSKPNQEDAYKKNAKLEDLIQEHNATNVIRLLTRLLFTWFIKEKKLIPDELFELDVLQKEILKDIAPYHENGLFVESNKESIYYKAILQNLFFATLNCPINSDSVDKRNRRFRLNNFYGQDRGNDWLYKYENHFKDSEAFLKLMNNCVPFLNGGLFECLDDKTKNLYIDGFSDNMTKGEQLIVPDYLFFGIEEHVDLSAEYGINNSSTQKAAVKGLINILRSYKFTITENTPIEEDVALDPELLGKVFENLLASYNPETKTTARKQTGSFYTPREIVSYMVDESLIAYLKTNVKEWNLEEVELDEQLHQLISYDTFNPFDERENLTKEIIHALDKCKILDPACGSGAFPMGALQKMVHVLQKLDPENRIWKEIQLKKVQEETNEVFLNIEDKTEREDKLKEINNAFDQKINDPDYARKLYLIENCIYGVDIQPIAIQISKLRFFISLVVDQKNNHNPNENFGIRPLPNLETKFVAANTLIGIEKENNLFTTDKVKDLEKQLKQIRHKLFSARTKDTKLKYRQKDEELRKLIADELYNLGLPLDSSEKIAKWDPYNQNTCSEFFDPEWMFDIVQGFDLVIGNPPYITYKGKEAVQISASEFKQLISLFPNSAEYKVNSYALFTEKGVNVLSKNGTLSYIIPSTILQNEYLKKIRKYLITKYHLKQVVTFANKVFEAITDSIILFSSNHFSEDLKTIAIRKSNLDFTILEDVKIYNQSIWNNEKNNFVVNLKTNNIEDSLIFKIEKDCKYIGDYLEVYVGIVANGIKKFLSNSKINSNYKKYLQGKHIENFELKPVDLFINFLKEELHSNTDENVYLQNEKILVRKTGNRLIAVIDIEKYYTDQSIYNLYPKRGKIVNLKVITGLLNSKLLEYYFNKKMITNPDVFPYIKGIHLKKLPIKFPNTKDDEKIFENLVLKITEMKIKNQDTTSDINKLNQLVYELYGLTEDEIRIVEENCS